MVDELSDEELVERLKKELQNADWKMLAPHLERGALITVSQKLDLITVGFHIARDHSDKVQEWMNDHLISVPTVEQIKKWNEQKGLGFFFLIIQPYILIQEKVI